jgi:hypothetical protein
MKWSACLTAFTTRWELLYTANKAVHWGTPYAGITFEHGKHSYRKFKQNTRSMQKRNRGAQVENSSIAWRSTNA